VAGHGNLGCCLSDHLLPFFFFFFFFFFVFFFFLGHLPYLSPSIAADNTPPFPSFRRNTRKAMPAPRSAAGDQDEDGDEDEDEDEDEDDGGEAYGGSEEEGND
jgi:hypothetical protein